MGPCSPMVMESQSEWVQSPVIVEEQNEGDP